ncbi:hypothetical protein BAC7755_46810 [Bacillus sp. MN7755]
MDKKYLVTVTPDCTTANTPFFIKPFITLELVSKKLYLFYLLILVFESLTSKIPTVILHL